MRSFQRSAKKQKYANSPESFSGHKAITISDIYELIVFVDLKMKAYLFFKLVTYELVD